jgi:hypothetical protein
MRLPWMVMRRFRLWTIFVVIAVLAVISTLWINQLRDRTIQRALVGSQEPSAWWPPGWRQELKASFTVEGDVTVAGKPVGAGTLSYVLEPEHRMFTARIGHGRYSFKRNRMPTGHYRVELRSEDGAQPLISRGEWVMTMDQGFHRINLAF